MGLGLIKVYKKFHTESMILVLLFAVTWLGFGEIMMGLFIVLFLASLFFKRNRTLFVKDLPLLILTGLFVLNNIISSILSIDPMKSTLLSLAWIIIYFITSYVRFALHDGSTFFMEIIGPSAIIVTLIIVLYMLAILSVTVHREGLVFERYHFRFLGVAGTADTLVMLGGIGYGWFRQKDTSTYRWYGFIYLLIGALGVLLTRDRGGAAAYFVLAVVLLISDSRRLAVFLGIIALSIILAFRIEGLINFRYLFDYLASKQGFEGLKSGSTLDTFKAAWLMIHDHWLMGVGSNNFSAFSTQYNLGNWYAYAHNIVLQFWAENGAFGMVLGLSIIGLLVFRWAKSYREYQLPYMAYGFGASFIGLLVGQMTNTTIWIVSIALPFWLLAGVMNALYFEVRTAQNL
jgi:O-antigen ligase